MKTLSKGLLAIVTLTLPVKATDAAIEKTAEVYRKAVLAGDATAVAATYRVDAVEMPPCRPPLKGRSEIGQYYQELFSGPAKITDFTFTYTETAIAGNVGYTTGAYKRTVSPNQGGPIVDSGNFVVIVKREAGVWKSAYVIYNSHLPPAVQGADAPVLLSPFPALMNYYKAFAELWLWRFGLVALVIVGILGGYNVMGNERRRMPTAL